MYPFVSSHRMTSGRLVDAIRPSGAVRNLTDGQMNESASIFRFIFDDEFFFCELPIGGVVSGHTFSNNSVSIYGAIRFTRLD